MVDPDLSVLAGVTRDLEEIAERDPALACSGMAAAALAMAREIDSGKNSATSKSMCAKALADMLDNLRSLAPEKAAGDALDELTARREKRIAR